MIKPTIGRRVWFWPNGATSVGNCSDFTSLNEETPFDAGVVYVWNDRLVNLDVADHYGKHFAATRVTLVQEGDLVPATGFYATWMPYQQGQAKKAEAAA